MASLSSVQAYLDEQKSTTKLVSREHPDFEALQACFAKKPSVQPALIALPQTAEDVQILVRYCAQNKVEFVVCTGGHDSPGGTEEQDVLWIDMRDIDHVDVTSDKTTVKVGGGILFRGLTKALGEKGLVTPAATIANVGYVGWATLGGYGPFSALYGLGADQIVSAKVVNSKGELVEASDELLDCIIGGGGIFGVIVELTIKVYSLKEIISPTPLDESSSGMILFATATWGGQIKKATSGHGKVALLNNRGTKLSKSTRMPNYCEKNEKPVAREPQGRVCAMSFKRYASATVAVQARYPNLLLGARIDDHVAQLNHMINMRNEAGHMVLALKENIQRTEKNTCFDDIYEVVKAVPDDSLSTIFARWQDSLAPVTNRIRYPGILITLAITGLPCAVAGFPARTLLIPFLG
ncbi:FAD-binding domain-containing protein [Xylaria longipes]|nr:FAD-binding domain-containing protein [Xylaria longipes]